MPTIHPMDIEISEVIKELGGTSAVAAMCNVKPPSVSEWSRNNKIPEAQCPVIEYGSGGKFACERVRGDVQWVRVPDAAWPHPQGRPLVDHAAKAGVGESAKEAA